MIFRIRAFALLIAVALVAGSLAVPSASLAQEDALPLGATGSIGGLDITVLDWIPDGTGVIEEAVGMMEPLPEDETYAIARLRIGNTGDNADLAMGMGLPAFGVAGSSRVGYLSDMTSCGSMYHSPLVITEIMPGSEGEVEICWRVPVDQIDSLGMFVREYDPSLGSFMAEADEAADGPIGIAWFSLGNDPVPSYDGAQVLDGEIVDDSTLENPIPVGSVGRIGSYEVAIASVNPDATDEVMASNEWNEPPGPGQQYMIVDIVVGYVGEEHGSINDLMFDPLRDYSTFFDTYTCDIAGAGFLFTPPLLFPGARTTASVCFLIDTESVDAVRLMVTTMEDLDAMPPFFSLQP